MSTDRYFGNSPVTVTKNDEEYLRIRTVPPGNKAAHACGREEFDLPLPKDRYECKKIGLGCSDPPIMRYVFETLPPKKKTQPAKPTKPKPAKPEQYKD